MESWREIKRMIKTIIKRETMRSLYQYQVAVHGQQSSFRTIIKSNTQQSLPDVFFRKAVLKISQTL